MKAIGWLIGVVLLLIVGLGVYLVMNTGDLIKTAVETLGPEYMGVDVKLGAADVSLTEGTGELRGLVVGNPNGFDGSHAFSLGRIKLALDPLEQSQELITLKTIEIDAADLALIAKGQKTNLQAIMANLESDAASEPAEESGAAVPKIIIDSFSFTNARTSLDSDILGASSGRDCRHSSERHWQEVQRCHHPGGGHADIAADYPCSLTEALARENLNVDEHQGRSGRTLSTRSCRNAWAPASIDLKDRFSN